MSDAVKVYLKHEFSWMKRDFIFLNFIIILSAIICRFFHLNGIVATMIMIFLLVKCFMFMKAYTVSPGEGASFSWKFLQGLPLSKIDLIKLIIVSGIISCMPFLLLMVLFWKYISSGLLSSDYNIYHVTMNVFLIFIYLHIGTIHTQIQYPRKEFQKKNTTNNLISSVSVSLISLVFLLYIYILFYLAESNAIDLSSLINFLKISKNIIFSWWSVPLLTLVNFLFYKHTLKIWIDEKKSYKPNLWSTKKEYLLISFLLILLVAPFYNIDFNRPSIYSGKANTLVYKKNYIELMKLLPIDNDSSLTNVYGMNPMLVALNEGNVDMVIFLETKGLTLSGNIKNKKSKYYGFDPLMFAINSGNEKVVEYLLAKNFKSNILNELSGFYPIHYAAYKCDPQMVDLLIKNGAELNVLNSRGETPLIVAAKNNCYSSVVSLIESGAGFQIVDKSGKGVLDHLKSYKDDCSESLKYYVEKHSRMPASNN